MIIEAGYDLLNLALPYFDFSNVENQPWVVIPTDEDLRCYGVSTVPRTPESGPLDSNVDRVLGALDDYVKYFAVAEPLPESFFDSGCPSPRAPLLEEVAKARGLDYFNHVYVGPETWLATGGMYTFSTYVGHEHLPRATVSRGPHLNPFAT
jgi:hypothetical protein